MKKLLEFIDNPNIAADLDDEVLKKIGEQVCEDYAADRDSMSEWSACVEDGLKVAKLDAAPKSFPWEGASNYKSPMIFGAVWKFGDRAAVELLGNKNLVKVSLEGEQVPENVSRKNRVTKHMNWQFNYEMPEWRKQQERLFYELACIGVVFKKTYFDPTEGRNVSRVIHYPNFAVNNETSVAGELTRFTECKDYDANDVQSFVASGVWIEPEIEEDDEDKELESDDDSDEEKDSSHGDFIEQHTCYDLDDDGYAEPYIITVHKPTRKVVRIVARYDDSSIYVKVGKGVVAKFNQAYQQRLQELAIEKQQQVAMELQQAAAGGEIEEINPDEFLEEMQDEALSSMKVVKIKATNLITEYSFVPDPEGKYLSWGFCHILSAYSKGVNTTTNQLIDAGTLANVGGGFMSSEFRGDRSPIKIKPGHWNKVDVPASVLANGLQYFQFKGADPSLLQLNEGMKAEAADIASVVNLQDAIAPNAPASTTLGILQEKLMPTTALLRRILESMSHEFRVMADLNARYTDPMMYQQVVDDVEANYQTDYEKVSQDIQPTASNAMTNATQKMQVASVLSSEVPNIVQSGGDVRPIMQFLFEGIGAEELFARVYPDPNSMSPEQRAALQQQQQLQQQMLQQQQIANQLQQASLEEQQIKNQLKQYELQIKESEAQNKQAESMAKMQREAAELQIKLSEQQIDAATAQADIERMLAQAEKYRAEASSTVVTTQVDAITRQLEFVRSNLGAFNQ